MPEDILIVDVQEYYFTVSEELQKRSQHNSKWPQPIDQRIFIGELDFFASPAEIVDFDLLIRHMKDLKEGRAVERPCFDQKTQSRQNHTVLIEPRPIIILEGALANANDQLRLLFDLSIYIECDNDVCLSRTLTKLEKEVQPLLEPEHQMDMFA